ncbi:TetR/AcrR family transcriptional regulator [Algoriphagus sp. CAU 1675]|uniref:TetR/AcrR family transcriptional regulator n=1 Tax=Algoriphagus sp. CAU 1675 TaxID=3032597 RepID=UPI0023DCB62F|nr:TetR/AcrR family transcriptional regulator [Algoriphagus sp. CAU 1675]MDF2158512.1 TetR/AcrR family transcriptional regulator [Algoriphagus sp. CAU 1675]
MSKKPGIERKILDTAYKSFLEKGYRHTTMDDIARQLGMSKKTLYNYYPGKLEMLAAAFQNLKTKMSAKVEAVLENRYMGFPLKLKSTLSVIAAHLAPINPRLFEEIKIHAPEVWAELKSYINESAYLRFQKLIEQGKEEGMIMSNVNVNLVVLLYAAAIQSLLDPDFTGQFPNSLRKGLPSATSDAYDQVVSILYNGILTEEARNEFANA